MEDPDWARLGTAIRDRRMALGAPRQADLAAQAGVSDTTWNLAETGKVVGARSRAKIALVLGWTTQSPDLVLAGGDPVLVDPPRVEQRFVVPRPEAEAIRLSAHGIDLDELHEKDPEAYEAIMRQAEIALNRARERRLG